VEAPLGGTPPPCHFAASLHVPSTLLHVNVAGNARGVRAMVARMPELRMVSVRNDRRTFGRLLKDNFNIVGRKARGDGRRASSEILRLAGLINQPA
jgi:hypothetical protein